LVCFWGGTKNLERGCKVREFHWEEGKTLSPLTERRIPGRGLPNTKKRSLILKMHYDVMWKVSSEGIREEY